MMRRREFIASLSGVAVFCRPFVALAQGPTKRPRIAFLGGGLPTYVAKGIGALIEGMRALGYSEGRDFEIEYRWAGGYLDRLPALAEELVRAEPAVIVAGNDQAAVALRDATKTVPIVCVFLEDPVRQGLMKSEARPGGNLTGLLTAIPGLTAKQLELARDLIPATTRIGLLMNPITNSTLSQRQEMETAGAALAVTIIAVEARSPDDLDPIFPALAREGVDVVIVLRDSMFFSQRRTIAAAALAARVPTIFPYREHVDDGGLISYGINTPESYRRAADYVVKILKGAKPGDLPAEFPTKLELVINLATAKALRLNISATLLARADEVIE
jgi:putative tryptophan/tyrosine transport system substrate-binding protein